MWKTTEGSTGKLIQLCMGYFFFYVVTGVTVRYFQFSPLGPEMKGMEFLTYSTVGGTAICLSWVIIRRWYRLKSTGLITKFGITFPNEFLYIIPSGVCTAVIIPTTTLMYSLKGVSVMVAMVIMRGSVIVVSRIIDSIQIKRGILKKTVYPAENWGVAFALLAVGTKMFWGVFAKGAGEFNFLSSPVAMIILVSYITAYAIRIYIMNYYKNTRPKGMKYDNKGFFAIEQLAASGTLALVAMGLFYASTVVTGVEQIDTYRAAILMPRVGWWYWAIFAGMAFGFAAFFSVFLFMFKGRTATFVALVNRLTSLVAGTVATLIFWFFLGGRFPKPQDWLSLAFIFVAVAFMTSAEKRRSRELLAAHEIVETVEEEEKEEAKEEAAEKAQA